jgi:hypothetical protein
VETLETITGYQKLLPSTSADALYLLGETADVRRRRVTWIPALVFPSRIWSDSRYDRQIKVNFGNPFPGYRFKPGECIVDTNSANDFRQGKCTQKDLDGVKMLVAEVGIDNKTGMESYRFFVLFAG